MDTTITFGIELKFNVFEADERDYYHSVYLHNSFGKLTESMRFTLNSIKVNHATVIYDTQQLISLKAVTFKNTYFGLDFVQLTERIS